MKAVERDARIERLRLILKSCNSDRFFYLPQPKRIIIRGREKPQKETEDEQKTRYTGAIDRDSRH